MKIKDIKFSVDKIGGAGVPDESHFWVKLKK